MVNISKPRTKHSGNFNFMSNVHLRVYIPFATSSNESTRKDYLIGARPANCFTPNSISQLGPYGVYIRCGAFLYDTPIRRISFCTNTNLLVSAGATTRPKSNRSRSLMPYTTSLLGDRRRRVSFGESFFIQLLNDFQY